MDVTASDKLNGASCSKDTDDILSLIMGDAKADGEGGNKDNGDSLSLMYRSETGIFHTPCSTSSILMMGSGEELELFIVGVLLFKTKKEKREKKREKLIWNNRVEKFNVQVLL